MYFLFTILRQNKNKNSINNKLVSYFYSTASINSFILISNVCTNCFNWFSFIIPSSHLVATPILSDLLSNTISKNNDCLEIVDVFKFLTDELTSIPLSLENSVTFPI